MKKEFPEICKPYNFLCGLKFFTICLLFTYYFLQSLVFRNHFEEPETVLFEVELIINNAPLTYAYPNTVLLKHV